MTHEPRRNLGFRRVNFGRNDSKMILKDPAFRQTLRDEIRQLDAGEGVHMTTDELRKMFEIEL